MKRTLLGFCLVMMGCDAKSLDAICGSGQSPFRLLLVERFCSGVLS